ncbi:MAG: hypothetical protein K2J11_05595 [Oscillospiraceae bacterium]|nr:hypothetical protein [Oscillospiraceae bacterium]
MKLNDLRAVIFTSDDKKCVRDFLSLPKRLYAKNELMQNAADEAAILGGTHTLSHYFTVTPILVYRGKRAICRGLMTVYPDDPKAYLGFFESENDSSAAKLLFDTAAKIARDNSLAEIIGPVDCSFWIKYRLKTSRFGSPYTGEPYNKDYYLKLWEGNGFCVSQRYFSNHYMVVESDEGCEKYADRLAEKLNGGYEIKSPEPESFDRTLREVYSLLIELYSNFPAYKRISESEFCAMFGYLRSIINYSMVKMAYFNKAAVGFFISVPNFGNTVYGRLTPPKLLKILTEKRKPRSYVMLYMGVDPNHRGLGKAFAETIRRELKVQRVPSVGALIRDGNSNQDYMAQLRDFEYEYALLRKAIV